MMTGIEKYAAAKLLSSGIRALGKAQRPISNLGKTTFRPIGRTAGGAIQPKVPTKPLSNPLSGINRQYERLVAEDLGRGTQTNVNRNNELVGQAWNHRFNSMPEVPQNHVRLFHQTGSDESAQAIRKTGLRYKDGINKTTYPVNSMSEVDPLHRAVSIGSTVAFDVPQPVYKQLVESWPPAGVLDPRYFVDHIPERKIRFGANRRLIPLTETYGR